MKALVTEKFTFCTSEDMSVKCNYNNSNTVNKENRIQCFVYFATTVLESLFNKDSKAIQKEE